MKRKHVIAGWQTWDDQVNGFVGLFRQRFGVAPNLLVASQPTLARIDIAADKANTVDSLGNHPEPAEYAPLACFRGPDYQLDFCVMDELADNEVLLVYDSNPDDDGGEPVPQPETDEGRDSERWLRAQIA